MVRGNPLSNTEREHMAPKTKAKAKAEEIEDDADVELDELDEDEVEDKPSKKGKSDDDVTFGVRDLCELVKRKTGKEYNPKEMRTLLRKMAREDTPRVDREIVRGNKARYSWPGPDHPEIKAVLKAVKGGEIETARKETLDALKEKKAKKDAAAKKGGKKGKKGKAKAEPEDEVEEEIEDFDDEDGE
jgi:hypothetical protein